MTMLQADILTWAQTYTGPKFHALLCDPPYGIEFMGKAWDKFGATNEATAYQKFSEDWLKAIWPHLYPGAWCMVFSSTRTLHRLMVAAEDVGYILQPIIMAWAFGSGFPKATNISAQIDDRAFRAWLDAHPVEQAQLEALRQAARLAPKAERVAALRAYQNCRKQIKAAAGFAPVAGTKKHQPKFAAAELGYREKDNGFNSKERESFDVHGPATDSAADWAGHRYGGQAIKPALEPIIVFQKPYDGSPVDNITSTGAGALWIDGGRIGTNGGGGNGLGSHYDRLGNTEALTKHGIDQSNSLGRWPANLVLVHAPECNGVCVPSCPVARLGAQSGNTKSGNDINDRPVEFMAGTGVFGTRNYTGHDDSGTASRYFYAADWMLDRLEAADPVAYYPKASTSEREAGLDPRQTAMMRLLDEGAADFGGAVVDDGRDIAIDNPYQRGETTRRNIHPTIKPISLSRYLATLLLPPAAYGPRRLLIPFAGVGSEYLGAMLAGWEEITGVELEADHVAIANARIAYWKQRAWELSDPTSKPTVTAAAAVPAGQLDMFMEDSHDRS